MARTNIEMMQIALLVAIGSYLGRLNFQGLNELFPTLSGLHPFMKILIGVGGIFILAKLGMRKQNLYL